ncbi:MAG: CDP-alcohol phosphatidyltransferase family protein [Oscillospiraceae bacterium]|nr:CDP-alcohol phosphatidyltransferase family protein [Oscillospiraceae bacterium]
MDNKLFDNWKTIPNLISLIRIFMIPVFAVLFYGGHLGWAVLILFLSGLSDSLDGKIARRFNQTSELGKLIDPVADKLTQITIAVMLYLFFRKSDVPELKMFSWVFLVFLFKELMMILLGFVMIFLGCKPIAAEIYGKVATVVFYVFMVIIICFGPEVGALRQLWTMPTLVLQILVGISALLTIVAFFSYAPGSIRAVKTRKDTNTTEVE